MGTKYYILLCNINLRKSKLSLSHSCYLRRIEKKISVFDLALAGTKGFRAWAVLEPLINSCRCELVSEETPQYNYGYDVLNRGWLISAMLFLKGYYFVLPVAFNTYSWESFAGQTLPEAKEKNELPAFQGGLTDYGLTVLSLPTEAKDHSEILEADAKWIEANFDIFNELAYKSDSFRMALEASIDWRYSKEPRSAISRIWGGIESLYGVNSELVFRISLYSATLLEACGEHRKERFNQVKKLYSMRSKVVHGEKVSDADMQMTLHESFFLLRELLLLCAKNQRVISNTDIDSSLFF